MVRDDGKWKLYLSEDDARRDARTRVRVVKLTWQGAGWYYVEEYTQRCPRNCCDDSVMEFTTAAKRAEEVAEGMRVLADEIRQAREYAKQNASRGGRRGEEEGTEAGGE